MATDSGDYPSKKAFVRASGKRTRSGSGGNEAGDWSFFDRVYCISLVNREDRRREAREQFAQVGLQDRVEFVLVDKQRDNPEQGIYESHLLCMRKGLSCGARHLLIFEDDVLFRRCSAERLAQLVDFMQGHASWDMFFLGCMVRRCRKLPGLPVAHIGYRSLTHAYAITSEYAESLTRQHPWNQVAYDDFLRDLQSECMYMACPAVAFQSDSPSDNDPYLHLDRMRRIWGGLLLLQRFDQWYHRFRWPLIALHVLVVAACLFWLLPLL